MAKNGTTKKTSAAKTASTNANGVTRGQRIVIILLVVILAISTIAGALASAISGAQASSTPATVAQVDENYQGFVSDLERQVESDPTNADLHLSLGRYYYYWGMNVLSLASVDSEVSHANELFAKAMENFDFYLDTNDDDSVRLDRILCLYYSGESSAAVTALEELTTKSPDFAPAWANLGLFYEVEGRTDDARAAYQTAIEKDPEDASGAKGYAEGRIAAMDSSSSAAAGGTGQGTSLSDTLSSRSGTGL